MTKYCVLLKQMKNVFKLNIILVILILFAGCQEEPPFINLSGERIALTDTTFLTTNIPTPQQKNVLIEDISGVNCVNCPDAAIKAIDIKDKKGKRIIIATLLPEKSLFPQFTDPGTIFTDLQNSGVNQMLNFVGTPPGLPSGMINRKDYGNGINLPYVTWDGAVNQALAETTLVNIDLDLKPNADKSETIVSVRITYTGTPADSNQNFTLMLLENDIIGVQKDRNGTNTNYTFEHVLRKYITNALGDPLSEVPISGRVFEKQYKIKTEPFWELDNCEFIALIHSAKNKEVYQSALLKIKQ